MVELAASTVQRLGGIQIKDREGTIQASLDDVGMFLKPLVTRADRAGTPESRQIADACSMFEVLERLAKVWQIFSHARQLS